MREGAFGAGQSQIHRVGVAAKIIARLKQRERSPALQLMRRCQTRNTRANDGHFHGAEWPKPSAKGRLAKFLNINSNLLVIL
jgi:hypothetical protein